MKQELSGTDTIKFHIISLAPNEKKCEHHERLQVYSSTSGKPREHLLPTRLKQIEYQTAEDIINYNRNTSLEWSKIN